MVNQDSNLGQQPAPLMVNQDNTLGQQPVPLMQSQGSTFGQQPAPLPQGPVLFVGGTRSGKSDLAQRYAEGFGPQRAFIATALVRDAETRQRMERHQARRGQGWHTVEAPLDLLQALKDCAASGRDAVALVDCITFWLCNLQEQGHSATQILDTVGALAAWLPQAPLPVALVTAEVGQGIVPASALGRWFRDLAGEVNQVLAKACPQVLLIQCGLPLALKGRIPKELL